MALLPLELDDIESLARAALEGSPPDPEHEAIRDLRRKIRSTIIYLARQIGAGTTFPIDGRAAFPDATGGSAEPNEAMAWSQQVLANPDAMLDAAFRVALYNNVDAPLASRALVVALGQTNDANNATALRNAMIPLLPLLTKGKHPGR